jgi:group I intron endonuclease
MGYVYLITNTVNGKKYIGQTQQKDIETRWKAHKSLDKRTIGRYLLNAYTKYGIDKFKYQIICICFDEACNELEEFYINKFNSLSPNGYNLKAGGKNSKHHPDTIKKMSEVLKGRILCPRTPEINKKISEALKGKGNPNYGKKMSEEQKKKISETQKKLWSENPDRSLNISQESRQKQLDALKKGRENSKFLKKSVGQYDLEQNLINTFSSITEANIKTNICRQSINKVCRGAKEYKTAGGFIWKYITNNN